MWPVPSMRTVRASNASTLDTESTAINDMTIVIVRRGSSQF
jgi:hypothetical protein